MGGVSSSGYEGSLCPHYYFSFPEAIETKGAGKEGMKEEECKSRVTETDCGWHKVVCMALEMMQELPSFLL